MRATARAISKLRLNQLKWYLRAVCNAILDYKMHCTGMTDEEALLFLMLRAFQSEGGGDPEDHPRQAEFVPAFDVLRGPDGLSTAAAAGAGGAGRTLRAGPLP